MGQFKAGGEREETVVRAGGTQIPRMTQILGFGVVQWVQCLSLRCMTQGPFESITQGS